ncbi:P-loop containing nucleoside triphosphate hydrolase protein [Melanogaster broomeanus]|nr:P-loop containing nucleoside triphosphate hydrolase protein [Melanogaster broomeanus]
MKSDTIILVLEAREGCRARLVEEDVRRRESVGEKLIFVLNKIDLVPRENAALSPTLHPYSSILLGVIQPKVQSTSATAPAVLRLLKAYKPSAAQSVTIGVVGFPNVGKSSLINSLKRSKVCAVAARCTKDLQIIDLERGIKIIDSPGVVVDEDEDESSSKSRMSNILLLLWKKSSIWTRTRDYYRQLQPPIIPKHVKESLSMLAVGSERLLKGGTPDVVSAAQQVLMDWNHQGPLLLRPILDPPVFHTFNVPSIGSGVAPWSRDHRPSSNPNRVVETVRASKDDSVQQTLAHSVTHLFNRLRWRTIPWTKDPKWW